MKQAKAASHKVLSSMIGGCLLAGVCSVSASEVGTVVWQAKYNPNTKFHDGYYQGVLFNTDGSVLAHGYRQEADATSAIGIRYDADTGDVINNDPSNPEWFLFEETIYDYAANKFAAHYVDDDGNYYFAGMGYADSFNSFSSRYNVPNIWKYDSGYDYPYPLQRDRPLWRSYYVDLGNTANNGEYYDMAVDSSDNLYAVGWFNHLASGSSARDWIIDKYDSNGTRVAGFPLSLNRDNLNDYAYAVAVDSEDNFVVVGFTTVDDAVDHMDWVVRKYDSSGTLLWSTSYDYQGKNDVARDVVIDREGNVIVAGARTNGAPNDDADWYIVKYAKDGDGSGGASIIWEQTWDRDDSHKIGFAMGMLLDKADNIYVIGSHARSSTSPVYTDRYRGVVQYRDGQTGKLLNSQDLTLIPTVNDVPEKESDYLSRMALEGKRLAIVGYTAQDGSSLLDYGRTARVVMLNLNELQVNVSGQGTVNSTPGGIDACEEGCAMAYPLDTTVTLTGVPNPDWTIARTHWNGDCSGTAPDTDCNLGMDGDKSVDVTFECVLIDISAPASPIDSQVNPWQCYDLKAVNGFQVVGPNGDVRFTATHSISLGKGFSIGKGARFAASVVTQTG